MESALALRKLMFKATTANTPNFGGHHGTKGFDASIGAEILRTIDTFIGSLKASSATVETVDQVRAQCNLARTMDIINDDEMRQADDYLDTIQETL